MSVIYGLADPTTLQIRYVGKTKYNPERRLAHHLAEAKRGKPLYVYNWIRLVGKPILVVLERDPPDLNLAERYWITQFQNLTNLTPGGDGIPTGYKHTPEAKANMKAYHTNRPKAHNAKIAKGRIGKTPWNKGKKGAQVPWNKGKKCPYASARMIAMNKARAR